MITRLPTSVSCFMSSHLCDKQPRAVTLAFTCLYFFTPFPPLGKFAKFHFSHEILQKVTLFMSAIICAVAVEPVQIGFCRME